MANREQVNRETKKPSKETDKPKDEPKKSKRGKEEPVGIRTPPRRCHCVHAFQDKMYGKGMRVMTYSTKQKEYRCTVCGARQRT